MTQMFWQAVFTLLRCHRKIVFFFVILQSKNTTTKDALCRFLNTYPSFSVHDLSCLVFPEGLPENEDSSDVQDIIESTPELDMDLGGYKLCR